MPNWVTNRVDFECEKEDTIKKIIEFLKGENGDVDFNNIIEMPEEIRDTESGSSSDNAYAYFKAKVLKDTASIEEMLTWPCAINDGIHTVEEMLKTLEKRDPDILEKGKRIHEIQTTYGCCDWYQWANKYWGTKWNACESYAQVSGVGFETAWRAVPELFCKLSCLFPTVKISYAWADEDFGNNCGEIIIQNGDVVFQNIPDGGTEEACKLAAEILGYELEDWEEEEDE